MAKKIAISFSVVFAVVLAVIVFSLVGAAYSTDTAALLEEAKAYEAEGNYGQAEAIYWSIVADYPGTDEAFQAQKNLAVLFITTRNYPAAQEEVDALITDFAGHSDLAQTIYDLADSWWYAAKFEESQKLFKYIVDNVPDNNLAIQAQAWVAGCDMKMGNYTAANQEIDALMKDFADNPQLTRVIYQLAEEFWRAGRYEEPRRLYEYIVENHPYSDLAIKARTWWAKGWITGLELILGNSTSAQQVIDVLVTDCAGQSQLVLGQILYDNANGCCHVGKYKEARELYKYIADNLPESDRFMRAKACVAGADLILGNYAAAQQAIDSLITNFNDHPDLPTAVSYIEEGYYIRILEAESPRSEDYYREPVEVWEKVTEKFPDFFYDDPDLYYFIACCYNKLGEYENAIAYYRKVGANWPNYYQAWGTLSLIESSYKGLKEAGAIGETEANTQIEQIYNDIIENSPKSTSAKYACLKLGRKYFDSQRWADAAFYFQLVWQDFPDDSCLARVVYDLGRAYEQMGETAIAMETYEEFLKDHPTDVRIKAKLEELKAANK